MSEITFKKPRKIRKRETELVDDDEDEDNLMLVVVYNAI